MANLRALRDHIYIVMQGDHKRRPSFNASNLYDRLATYHAGKPPVSRTTIYQWFGKTDPTIEPSALLLECVPALAKILEVREYDLFHVAGVLPAEIDASSALSTAAHDFRDAFQLARRALADAGLSSAGEAVVVDRILQHRLDYKITIRPIVRGSTKPIHLHSWIILSAVEEDISRHRSSTSIVDRMHEEDQREHIRKNVITEGLWRSLGLRWRTRPGPEWPFDNELPLCIEVPVEERNRERSYRTPETGHGLETRILALSAPFSHGELLVAFLAGSLGLGTHDLRYQGFSSRETDPELLDFCRSELVDTEPGWAWALAQGASVLDELGQEIVESAKHHLVIWLTYGTGVRKFGARVLDSSPQQLREAARMSEILAKEINQTRPIIRVDFDDLDCGVIDERKHRIIDFNRLTDRVRYAAAGVLNVLYDHNCAPSIEEWGENFDDLRRGTRRKAVVPDGLSKVRWFGIGEM